MFGVLNLEFKDCLPISARGKAAAKDLVAALSRIIWLHETNRTQLDDTRTALHQLQGGQDTAVDALRRRTVFLASSSRADASVVQTLRSVLNDDFDEYFDLEFWQEEAAIGSISEHVRTTIASAEFGVCYMSEPAHGDSGPAKYVDNPNVLFEAGMFQMLHQLRDDPSESEVSRWIPVREGPDLTTPLPFDFAGDRILVVPRNSETEEVDTEELADRMRNSVRQLITALGID